MLGKLIAEEIAFIEAETKCGCHKCSAHRAVRLAVLYKKTLKCHCPVCETTVTALKTQIDSLRIFLKSAEEQKREIESIQNKLVIVPEEAEYANGQALAMEKNQAGAIVLCTAIENMLIDFQQISDAAHYGYSLAHDMAHEECPMPTIHIYPPETNLDIN